ncbi:Ribonuclease H1 [Trichophyton interdigitale]|uniref:Ribonuclease H1 n=1 Tax=Trichophyton interdigitale TaxID=101480 RepID=A0A9P5CZF1_9EURO|nr:Ribonuclease H1 [Trichophyton interdigitale]KAF3900282.1 Ribonuclease H1 [Trichophyton interdigitale]KAG8211290.1 Ribonuclease H1 [Trichophyton interdigitale]
MFRERKTAMLIAGPTWRLISITTTVRIVVIMDLKKIGYQPESYINDEEDFEGPHTSPEAFIELIDAQGFHGDDFYNDCQDAYSLGEITSDFYSDSYGCSYRDSSDCITMMITMMIAMTIATTIVTMVTTMIPTMITDIDGTEYGIHILHSKHNGIQTICVRTLAPKSHHTPTMLNNFRSDVYSEIVAKDNKH